MGKNMIVSSLRAILVAVKPWHVNDPNRPEGVGVGAFNMVRRVAFENTMGFEWFKMDVVDDVHQIAPMKNASNDSNVLLAWLIHSKWRKFSVENAFLGLEKCVFTGCPL